jgi:hypothetical protein
LGQQIEEYRRAGSRLPDDQHRIKNGRCADLRVAVVPINDPKPALEEIDDHGHSNHLAHFGQITFGMK